MSTPRGGETPPTPPFSAEEAFRHLIDPFGKKSVTPSVPKFINKLDAIPEIDLPEEQPIKIALALDERGLVE